MRLALQALFTTTAANEEETARRALLERKLRADERSAEFFRRLRAAADDPTLRAPEIFAEESFPDANVVAEYLDGQAAPELARAYEDACWDSPEMLAEIGRCCDILNNDALNSVVAPKNCRRRLYYIAWEENVANAASEETAPTLTVNLATSESCVAQDETEPSDGESRRQETEIAETLTPNRQKTKRNQERKKPKSVRSTLEAERSWGRRVKRLSARLTMALGLLAVGYCGWRTLQEKPSETLQLKTPSQAIETANNEASSLNATEEALRPTTISTSNFEEIPAFAYDDKEETAPSSTVDDWASVGAIEAEPLKLAAVPDGTDSQLLESSNMGGSEQTAERRRVGLGSDEPWQSRPAIEIPAQNNDVFTKTKLY